MQKHMGKWQCCTILGFPKTQDETWLSLRHSACAKLFILNIKVSSWNFSISNLFATHNSRPFARKCIASWSGKGFFNRRVASAKGGELSASENPPPHGATWRTALKLECRCRGLRDSTGTHVIATLEAAVVGCTAWHCGMLETCLESMVTPALAERVDFLTASEICTWHLLILAVAS